MARKYLLLGETLKRILFDRNMRSVDLARALNIPAPTIHRIVTGKSTRPSTKSLELIAKFFDISVGQLLGEQPIANNGLLSVFTSHKAIRAVPVIPFDRLGDNSYCALEHEIVLSELSQNAFVTFAPDYSMDPMFVYGCTLVFDTEFTLIDRCYVLVRLHDSGVYVFRQLLLDGEKRFVRALNGLISNGARQLSCDDKIIGRLVEARNKL